MIEEVDFMSDQNEMKSNKNQEVEVQDREIGILQAEACCDNGCILTDAANVDVLKEGTGNTASGFASHAEGFGTTVSGGSSFKGEFNISRNV